MQQLTRVGAEKAAEGMPTFSPSRSLSISVSSASRARRLTSLYT